MDPNFISIMAAEQFSGSSQHSSQQNHFFATVAQQQSSQNLFENVLGSVSSQPPHMFTVAPPLTVAAAPHGAVFPLAAPQMALPNVVNSPMVILPMAPQQPAAPSHPPSQGMHPGISDTVGPMIVGGRLRHGGNAHVELRHSCKYFSYKDGEELKALVGQGSPKEQILPMFVQMFPSEHKDHTAVLFEKVLLLICGPGAGCVVGVEPRSDTSFIAFVRTSVVWHVLYNLRYRVLMDRHGFWYAENVQQYVSMRDYCESVRMLPQHARHAKTDGMPSMPLVLELSRTISRSSITAPPAPAPFDVQFSGNANIC